MNRGRHSLLLATGLLLVLGACAPGASTASATPSSHAAASPSSRPTASPSPRPSPSPFPSPSPSLLVQIGNDEYGFVSAITQPGATCNARAILPNGKDATGLHNPQIADASGTAAWRYPSPGVDTSALGQHIVSCSLNGLSGSAWAYFSEGN